MKNVFFLASLCCALTLSAQEAEYPKKESLEPIEKMQLRLQYDVDWHHDVKHPEDVKHDKMYTEVGQTLCHSYIEREWNDEIKFNKSFEDSGKRGTNAFVALYSNIGETFIGYPKGMTTVIYSLDMLNAYRYEEETTKLEWTITSEKLDTLDYHCTLATCSYAGRQYKAWFTEDIPVSYGPWKLCGLPGLIIKAETADGDYRFTLAGIEKVKEDKDICLWKREFITKAKDKVRLQEKMLLTRPDEIMDWLGISYTTVSYDGSKVKLKFFTYDNPLEKDEQ